MDRKDYIIQALQEMVNELSNKLINLRVEAGVALAKKDEVIAELKNRE